MEDEDGTRDNSWKSRIDYETTKHLEDLQTYAAMTPLTSRPPTFELRKEARHIYAAVTLALRGRGTYKPALTVPLWRSLWGRGGGGLPLLDALYTVVVDMRLL